MNLTEIRKNISKTDASQIHELMQMFCMLTDDQIESLLKKNSYYARMSDEKLAQMVLHYRMIAENQVENFNLE